MFHILPIYRAFTILTLQSYSTSLAFRKSEIITSNFYKIIKFTGNLSVTFKNNIIIHYLRLRLQISAKKALALNLSIQIRETLRRKV